MILFKDWKPKDAEGTLAPLQHSISCAVVLHMCRGSQPHTLQDPHFYLAYGVLQHYSSLRMFVRAQTSGHDRASIPWVDIAIGDMHGGQGGVKAACAAVPLSLQA